MERADCVSGVLVCEWTLLFNAWNMWRNGRSIVICGDSCWSFYEYSMKRGPIRRKGNS